MLIFKTRPKKYTPKNLKNQIWLYLHRRKIPLKFKSSVHALKSKVANSIFTLVTPVIAPPQPKTTRKNPYSLTGLLTQRNQGTHTAKAQVNISPKAGRTL